MIEVPEVWRLVELIQVHKYVRSHGYGGEPYPDKVKKSEKKLISEVKRILNLNIKNDNFETITTDIEETFKLNNLFSDQYPFIGPIGNFYHLNNGLFLDLDDIEKAYVSLENFKGKKLYGSVKSKTCGWIAWCTVGLKKNVDRKEMDYVVSFNHHKQETALGEMFEKKNKYNTENLKRKIKSIFISRRNWHHDDLEKLNKQLPYTSFLKY